MSFQPIIPYSGMAGWTFLQRTQEAQLKAFEAQPVVQNDLEYFRENIAKVQTPDDLVSDYRLFKVALGAFGLEDDLPNKAFMKKVLSEGTIDPESFANNLLDKRYFDMAEKFGFDLGTPNTVMSDFSDDLLAAYTKHQFEVAVGEQDTDMRLAMTLQNDLGDIAESKNSDNGRWYAVLGNEPLRQVFETALGLPDSIVYLDLDKQVEMFRDKADAYFGDGEITQFTDPEARDDLTKMFLARSQVLNGTAAMSAGSIALTLLQNAFG